MVSTKHFPDVAARRCLVRHGLKRARYKCQAEQSQNSDPPASLFSPSPHALAYTNFPSRKQTTRPRRSGRVVRILAKFALPADHRRAEKVEHFLNRLRDRKRRAAGIKQADGTRIPLLVFHHQRARVATGDKRIADGTGDQDLSCERLGEGESTRALILISHRNSSVEARHRACRQTSRAPAFLDSLVDRGRDWRFRNRSDFENPPLSVHHALDHLADRAVDIAPWERALLYQGGDGLRAGRDTAHVD